MCSIYYQVEYKKGHEERVSKYTTVIDTPEVLLAKSQGKIASDVSINFPDIINIFPRIYETNKWLEMWSIINKKQVVYMEEYEQQRGKGSFPAHFTPGYQVAKKANEMASKVSAHM